MLSWPMTVIYFWSPAVAPLSWYDLLAENMSTRNDALDQLKTDTETLFASLQKHGCRHSFASSNWEM